MELEKTFRDIQVTSSDIEVRKIGVSDLWQSLREGLDDFNAKPTFGLFVIVVYPLFALLLTLVLQGDVLMYLAFPIVAGCTLLGPVITVGLCELSRRRERGLPLTWRSMWDFVHTSSFAPILALSIFMMVLYVAWLFMAELIYFGRFGTTAPASFPEFWNALFTTRAGAGLVLHGTVVGFIFAFVALAVSVVSFPLLLDKPASALTAAGVSIRAVTSNLFVMLLWGLLVAVLLALGALLFLIGLAAVMPILGHATWHLYRKAVVA